MTHPMFGAASYQGQVPRLDAVLDAMFYVTPSFGQLDLETPQRPVLQASRVTDGLGLPDHIARNVMHVVKHEAPIAANEIGYRRSVMETLLEQKLEPACRREVLSRAISYYRNRAGAHGSSNPHFVVETLERAKAKKAPAPPRGGRYHKRIPKKGGGYEYIYDPKKYSERPDAHVDGPSTQKNWLAGAVRKHVESHGEGGCHVTTLKNFVDRYGSKAVVEAIRSHKDLHLSDEHLHVAGSVEKSRAGRTEIYFVVAEPVSLVLERALPIPPPVATPQAAGAGAAGSGSVPPSAGGGAGVPMPPPTGHGHVTQGISPKALPPGTKKLWHNRIVEKQGDEKWHVVGHVAGLEEQHKPRIEPLKNHEISPEHLRELLLKIRELEAKEREGSHERSSDPKADQGAPQGKGTPRRDRGGDRE